MNHDRALEILALIGIGLITLSVILFNTADPSRETPITIDSAFTDQSIDDEAQGSGQEIAQ